MFGYQLLLAWKSLKRTPVLSLLMIIGISLGMALATTSVGIYFLESGDPIPHKSDRLYYVQLDSWSPDEPFSESDPSAPPYQITHLDMTGIMESDIPTYQSGMYRASVSVQPESRELRPYWELARLCHGDFFRMFDVPFEYGGGWDRQADAGPEPVVVLGSETNQRLFGGANSVGRLLRIEDREFRVVGVMGRWRPMPRFYDTIGGTHEPPEEIFLPFRFGPEWKLRSAGSTWNWTDTGGSYQDLLQSEAVWIQMWVQLDDAEQRQAYMSFLDAYVMEQKTLGRFARPLNNRLSDVMEWLRAQTVISKPTRTMLVISMLFLLICSVNLVGILLGKFLARAPEVGVRRALGASRRWVFTQHLLECGLVGVAGGVLGLALALLLVRVVNSLFEIEFALRVDPALLLATLALALLSAFVAGAYPAWRICRVAPAAHLKTQ